MGEEKTMDVNEYVKQRLSEELGNSQRRIHELEFTVYLLQQERDDLKDKLEQYESNAIDDGK